MVANQHLEKFAVKFQGAVQLPGVVEPVQLRGGLHQQDYHNDLAPEHRHVVDVRILRRAQDESGAAGDHRQNLDLGQEDSQCLGMRHVQSEEKVVMAIHQDSYHNVGAQHDDH